MAALKYFYCQIVKRLALQNTNLHCFVVINNGVMVLNSNSVVPFKTRYANDKRHSAHHKCLARMSVSNTTSLVNQKLTANSFKLRIFTCFISSPFELKILGI